MIEKQVHQLAPGMLEQLPKGAFLTVKNTAGITNTMTIGWGSIGYSWGKPILMVMVRKSRYTYELLEQAQDFTVSFPTQGQLTQELGFCGTKSGRDVNKWMQAPLRQQDAQQVNSPVVAGCDVFAECKRLLKSVMNSEDVCAAVMQDWYANGDLHTLYFGEIVACYRQ